MYYFRKIFFAKNSCSLKGEKNFWEKCTQTDIIYWNLLEPIEPIKLHKSHGKKKTLKKDFICSMECSAKKGIHPSGLLDFVFYDLRALKACDPR